MAPATPVPASSPLEEVTGRLLSLVHARTGLSFPAVLRSHVKLAIRQHLAHSGIPDPSALLRGIEQGRIPLDPLVERLSIKETYFFREPAQFDFIQCEVIPDLARRRGAGPVCHAWSAGCATGEEPYSLAIVLEESGIGDRVEVIGTDLSADAIAKAQAGAYRAWSFRGSAGGRVRAYCTRRHDDVWTLRPTMLRRVRFFTHNLSCEPAPRPTAPSEGWDLILCRNVLLYFPEETALRAAARLVKALSPDGWLIMGSTDPLLGALPGCEAIHTDAGQFYRRRNGAGARRLAGPRPPRQRAPTGERDAALWEPAEWSPEAPPWREAIAPAAPEPEVPAALPPPGTSSIRPEWLSPLAVSTASASPAERVRACAAEGRAAEAIAEAERALEAQPFDVQVHLLLAIVLSEQERWPEAAEAARRAIYLDPTQPVAHFTRGMICKRLGLLREAGRAFRNAASRCAGMPEDAALPDLENERAGELMRAALNQLHLLEARR